MEMPTVTMQVIPMEHGLLLAAILFIMGMVGVLTRRNLVFILMSLEIMLTQLAWHLSLLRPTGGRLMVK